jgi:hypothetical protein
LRYSSWKGVYAGYVRREMNRHQRTRPQPGITVRQYDSHKPAFKPAKKASPLEGLLPVALALVAVLVGLSVAMTPAPPALQTPEVEAQH